MLLQGDKIEATNWKQLLYVFESKLVEGEIYVISKFSVHLNKGGYWTSKHQYKLYFEYKTNVKKTNQGIAALPKKHIQFHPPIAVFREELDCHCLIGV